MKLQAGGVAACNAVVAVPQVHGDLQKSTLWPQLALFPRLMLLQPLGSRQGTIKPKSRHSRIHRVAPARDRLVITLVLCRENPPIRNRANDVARRCA
jgi:hypothetical protein